MPLCPSSSPLWASFPSTKCSGSQRALPWTYSCVLLGSPFQNTAPIHIDFENSILTVCIPHSGCKYAWPGGRQQLFDWSPCLLCASNFSLAFCWDDISKLEFWLWLLPSNEKEKVWVADTYKTFKIWAYCRLLSPAPTPFFYGCTFQLM